MHEADYILALAGLLHDVGKFAIRTSERESRTWDEQALLTADFIERYVPEPWRVPVKDAAGHHHQPRGRGDHIVALADRLSAGERADPGEDENTAQPPQLLSIFCSLAADGTQAPADAFWPLTPLRLDRAALFPGPSMAGDQVRQTYHQMWDAFTAEAGRLRAAQAPTPDLPAYVESLLLLLQRYTWAIPSATMVSRRDISLYDHGRMSAALAALLNDAGLDDGALERLAQAPGQAETPLALLVGGDLSGVQDFIYTITARGATSALRGRSFYLQMLTEAVARYVLRRLELPLTNLIYAGGGNFYLLARPNDDSRLREVQREISQVLLRHHHGDLYMALATHPLQGADFFDGRIGAAWRSLGEKLQRAKRRRFAELDSRLADLFTPQGHGGNEEEQCQVCGSEDPDVQVEDDPDVPPERRARKCPACRSYETLGEDLRRARFLVLDELPLSGTTSPAGANSYTKVLAELGLRIAVSAGPPQDPPEGERRVILALADDALPDLRPAARTAIGRRLLVNVTPTITQAEITALRGHVDDLPKREGTKTFGALEAQSLGIPRLGVLRMDVDNLGRLFAEGLGPRATLSRVAALSFAISLYFEGWVGYLAAAQNAAGTQTSEGERLYSIYSGGDDLFFVGSWDAVVEFARQVRADLTPYAAGHPGIHASAGIALVGGKYPLYQAAQEAGAAEAQAKGLRWMADGHPREKDAISFLGQALPWDRFGLEACSEPKKGTAHELMHRLVGMTADDGAPRGLLRRLIGLHEQYQEAARKRREAAADQNQARQEQVLWGPWMWQAVYTLTRMADQNRPARENIKALRDQLKADDFRSLEWVGLAARWAELRLRKGD